MLKNTIQYQIHFWNSVAKESFSTEDFFVFTTGIKNPLINLILFKKQDMHTLTSIMPKAQDFFDRHKVPWGINIIDDSSAKKILPFLENRKFKKICTQFEMQTELNTLPQISTLAPNIKEAINANILRDWTIPIASGFEATSGEVELYYKLNKVAFNKKSNPLTHFVLYENTTPVSSATLSIYDKVIRLGNVATIKAKQRQGHGRKIIEYCVDKAQKLGSKYMVFESSEQGISLYRKMGFAETAKSYIYSLSNSL